ncbi:uncharacterized protein ACHE_30770S [Aspergillus chevalieri]|uniref:Conidiation-specific protein n=1 Tax=Aspergillus chevalieri TaxID=182096 RepID=A0A7R7VMR8_ASPCH|nr:uncharacterized protein ACHE_30770S [Aspergillus chevalieri]BCR86783.1 hypothetical protein ACHE_30770S [Aspergillus chevalieri]
MSSNRNPNTSNFAFPPHDQAQKMAQNGGQQSSQGIFGKMDPTKQNMPSKSGLSGGGFTANSQTAQDSQRRGSRQAYMFDESEMPED